MPRKLKHIFWIIQVGNIFDKLLEIVESTEIWIKAIVADKEYAEMLQGPSVPQARSK